METEYKVGDVLWTCKYDELLCHTVEKVTVKMVYVICNEGYRFRSKFYRSKVGRDYFTSREECLKKELARQGVIIANASKRVDELQALLNSPSPS